MIDPIAIKLGPIAIHWYSISYLVALTVGFLIAIKLNKKKKIFKNNDQIFNMAFWLFLVGVIIGGRLGYVLFYNFSYFMANPAKIPAMWDGGMSFHGGLIGSIIVLYFFCKNNKINFLDLGDTIAVPTALALMFTRIANFINRELVGRVIENADFKWLGVNFGDGLLRYPSQLFQSASSLILALILLLIFYRKPKRGIVTFSYIGLYGLFRFITEFWRAPDVQVGFIWSYFTLGQLLSLGMLIIGSIGLLIIAKK